MISDANVKILLNQPEWTTFECKRALVEPAKLLDTIVAFANTDGGYLVIGLEDPNKARGLKRLVGISERPDSVSEFLKLVEKEIEPPGIIYKKYELGIVNNIGKPDKLVVIKIDKSNGVVNRNPDRSD